MVSGIVLHHIVWRQSMMRHALPQNSDIPVHRCCIRLTANWSCRKKRNGTGQCCGSVTPPTLFSGTKNICSKHMMNPNGLPSDVHSALARLKQAKQQREQEQITRARQRAFLPSCSVNIDPNSITFNFNKYSNPKLA